MYIKKVEYLQHRYPLDRTISGMSLMEIESLIVGTPVIGKIDPFMAVIESDEGIVAYYKDENKRATAMDLRNEDPKTVNKILAHSVNKMAIMQMFCSQRGCYDYNEFIVNGSNFHFSNEILLIYDEGYRVTTEWISDVIGKSELRDIGGFLSGHLRSHRYFNITLTGLGMSKKARLMTEINTLINTLRSEYPHSRGSIQNTDIPRYLVDIMSISFYKLVDVIPIYDIHRTKGIMVEFTLTSSGLNGDTAVLGAQSYRFIFSKSKDGVFTIDGEKIKRPSESPTDKCAELVCNILANSMPRDNLKPKRNRAEEV